MHASTKATALVVLLLPFVLSLPAPTPTSPPIARRDLASGLASLDGKVTSYIAGLPSDIANGILPAFTGLPTPDKIKSQFNLTNADIQSQRVQVLNIPGYANWTASGWALRIHGSAYRTPNLTNAQLDEASKPFLVNLDPSNMTAAQLAESRNVTGSLFVIPEPNIALNFSLQTEGSQIPILLTRNTSDIGEFDETVALGNVSGVPSGAGGGSVVKMDLYSTVDSFTGNATSYFVPSTGMTIVSDIDDILRVTKIYQPDEGLDNSFANPYTPWMNMNEIYSNWNKSYTGVHFHYLTTLPEQVTRAYESFIYADYPLGSFDDRPENFTTVDQTLSIRKVLLTNVIQSFPQRKFVLVADTSNSDVMKDYPLMQQTFPDQVTCILLRNTSATDPEDKFPYDTSGFQNVPNSTYMFFRTPDDLVGIDLSSGGCRNATVPQNVTFKYQGLPDALASITSAGELTNKISGTAVMLLLVAMGVMILL